MRLKKMLTNHLHQNRLFIKKKKDFQCHDE